MNYMYNEPPFKIISEENPQYNYYISRNTCILIWKQ